MAAMNVGFGTPFQEQIDYLVKKLRVPTERWDDIQRSAHDRAFMVAGAAQADLLKDLHDAVVKASQQGLGLPEFRKDFARAVAKHGWTGWTGEGTKDGEAWRTKVIYQTNMAQSYWAGRYRQMSDPEVLKLRPYWRYIHSDGVAHPRPHHLAWHGLTLKADHPFWQTHFAPNGWGCRCRIEAVSKREGEASAAAGLDDLPADWDAIDPKTGTVVGIDKGFDYAPGAGVNASMRSLVEAKLIKLPHKLADALRADMDRLDAMASTGSPPTAPWRAHTAGTAEGDWHDASFADAPQWLKDAVAKRGALQGGVVQQKGVAHYSSSSDHINMGQLSKGSLTDQGTWRHEYGHAMDRHMRAGHVFRSSAPDFKDAMDQDARDLVTLGGHGPKSYKATKAALAKLSAAYADNANELMQTPDRVQWLTERYAKNGMDFGQVQAAMNAQTDFASNLQGIGLHSRYARIITAIEQRDAQGLMDALTGGMGPQNMAERRATYDKGAVGNLSDLFGSATSNKVSGASKSGFGHPDAYYKHSHAGPTECFANLTCFYGDASPVWSQIIEAMTPRMAQLFKEIMK